MPRTTKSAGNTLERLRKISSAGLKICRSFRVKPQLQPQEEYSSLSSRVSSSEEATKRLMASIPTLLLELLQLVIVLHQALVLSL
mmetsp:Transcript_75038/g.195534  ORF Transcript_75038/g.195534 Transcript_75038/m.195534 type:complete len:85 (+) Transcript_75038:386-640(+)